MFRNLTFILVFICLACQGQTKVEKAQGNPVEFEVIMDDQQSNDKREAFRLVNSSSDLLKIVGKANMNRSKAYKLPQVDFSSSSLLYLNLGEKTTAGYGITVTDIVDTGSDWIVYYSIKSPGEGEMAATVMTTHFVVVKIPRASKPVRFTELPKA